jgi:hypothetical protein
MGTIVYKIDLALKNSPLTIRALAEMLAESKV